MGRQGMSQNAGVLVSFPNIIPYKCDISLWNWSDTMNIYSILWILMAWCFTTRPPVATVLSMHPCISSYLWVNDVINVPYLLQTNLPQPWKYNLVFRTDLNLYIIFSGMYTSCHLHVLCGNCTMHTIESLHHSLCQCLLWLLLYFFVLRNQLVIFNISLTHWGLNKMRGNFADDIFRCIFFMKILIFLMKFSWSLSVLCCP